MRGYSRAMRVRTLALVVLVVSAVALTARPLPSTEPPSVEELLELYRQRDYFALRDHLGGIPESAPTGSAEMRFLAAAVQHAFNRSHASNQTLLELSAGGAVPVELVGEARRLRMANHLRLHEYGPALAVARRIVQAPLGRPAPKLVSEVRNTALLLAALADIPPQQVAIAKTGRINRRLDGRVPIEIGGRKIRLAVDTGANLSVLMRSEAERAGLVVREVGLQVATATGKPAVADVAVADRVRFGTATYRNVVFLIFADDQLTFPDGTRIPGLVGFPMLEALGEVRFWADNTLEIPARPPRRKRFNLALDDHEPLVRARAFNQDLVCRLDTGANRTFFYSPFYRRFRERIHAIADPQKVKVGGVGGLRKVEVFRAPFLTINLARADVQLSRVDIYSAPLVEGAEEYLDCNIGRDALEEFRYYAINLRDMALVLG